MFSFFLFFLLSFISLRILVGLESSYLAPNNGIQTSITRLPGGDFINDDSLPLTLSCSLFLHSINSHAVYLSFFSSISLSLSQKPYSSLHIYYISSFPFFTSFLLPSGISLLLSPSSSSSLPRCLLQFTRGSSFTF